MVDSDAESEDEAQKSYEDELLKTDIPKGPGIVTSISELAQAEKTLQNYYSNTANKI
jgi:hypothetical protein